MNDVLTAVAALLMNFNWLESLLLAAYVWSGIQLPRVGYSETYRMDHGQPDKVLEWSASVAPMMGFGVCNQRSDALGYRETCFLLGCFVFHIRRSTHA
ncbi:hypothetical protein [Fibrella aquatilis]|uniref:Uncharacterized protein n=1 Tax=Fibrella aquatilis TaxID=2817059 RepID=A0A939G4Z7_9BACT|nr:hypothetical protein [Fibrella aquatilis]MBO0930332.1 hypothetical protein [Fibrella aquatilis]